MRPLDQWAFDTLHWALGNNELTRFLQGLGHLANYSIVLVFVLHLTTLLWGRKQFVKAYTYVGFITVIFAVVEITKYFTALYTLPQPLDRTYFELGHPITGTALSAYMMGILAASTYQSHKMLIMWATIFVLGAVGRIHGGANYASEIIVAWVIVIPFIVAFGYYVKQIDELYPPRRRKDDKGVNGVEQLVSPQQSALVVPGTVPPTPLVVIPPEVTNKDLAKVKVEDIPPPVIEPPKIDD